MFKHFRRCLNDCLYAETENEFEKMFFSLKFATPDVGEYLEQTWFSDFWKKRLLRCYTMAYPTFGISSTSRVESAHWSTKSWLISSRLNVLNIWESLEKLWNKQVEEMEWWIAKELRSSAASLQHTKFFGAVNSRIYQHALLPTNVQFEQRLTGNPTCRGNYWKRNGLPCKHIILSLLRDNEILLPTHFHRRWWIEPENAPQYIPPILEPVPNPSALKRRNQRSHKKRAGKYGNRRIESEHERPQPSQPSLMEQARLPAAGYQEAVSRLPYERAIEETNRRIETRPGTFQEVIDLCD